jgi:hypothetical protein
MEAVVTEVRETTVEQGVPQGNAIEYYVTLTHSPLILTPIIDHFFKALKPFEKNILLGYLVLPIVLHPASQSFLSGANSRSSVRTFCSDRIRLAGLPQRIADWRKTSGLAMQNSIDCERLILHENLSIEFKQRQPEITTRMLLETNAAKRLASIFEPYDIPTIYRLLGVNVL